MFNKITPSNKPIIKKASARPASLISSHGVISFGLLSSKNRCRSSRFNTDIPLETRQTSTIANTLGTSQSNKINFHMVHLSGARSHLFWRSQSVRDASHIPFARLEYCAVILKVEKRLAEKAGRRHPDESRNNYLQFIAVTEPIIAEVDSLREKF
ncbi:MAG TPA: hypothetical protein VFX54_16785 [Candidatus Binatia bacterium]|nr:hypothetical protein [Candidatus Binatia bacterium]